MLQSQSLWSSVLTSTSIPEWPMLGCTHFLAYLRSVAPVFGCLNELGHLFPHTLKSEFLSFFYSTVLFGMSQSLNKKLQNHIAGVWIWQKFKASSQFTWFWHCKSEEHSKRPVGYVCPCYFFWEVLRREWQPMISAMPITDHLKCNCSDFGAVL